MKRIIPIIAICVAIFCSCTDYMNKPIMEPMTVDELKGAMKQDSDFMDFYEGVQKFRKDFFADETNQVKYGEITYRRVYDLLHKTQDSTFCNEVRDNARKEWETTKKDYSKDLDKLKKHWTKFRKENNIANYVKIEFDHIDKDYYYSLNRVKDVYMAFRITAVKEKIDQLTFTYEVNSKIEEGSRRGYLWNDDRGSCILTTPVSSSAVKLWEAPYSLKDKLENKTTAEFKRDYDISISVTKLRIGGKNYDPSDFEVPYVIENYLDDPKDEYYTDRVIQEYIDEKYIPFSDFFEDKMKKAIEAEDKECYEFMNVISEFTNR